MYLCTNLNRPGHPSLPHTWVPPGDWDPNSDIWYPLWDRHPLWDKQQDTFFGTVTHFGTAVRRHRYPLCDRHPLWTAVRRYRYPLWDRHPLWDSYPIVRRVSEAARLGDHYRSRTTCLTRCADTGRPPTGRCDIMLYLCIPPPAYLIHQIEGQTLRRE